MSILPDDLALGDIMSYGGVLSRVNTYAPAIPQGPYIAGQQIQVQLPMEMIDFRNHALEFTIQGSQTGTAPTANTLAFNSDIRSIFKRITIQFGSQIVYDCIDQNVLYNILDLKNESTWASTVGKLNYGTGTLAQRSATFLSSTSYAVQLYSLDSELLRKVLPLQKLGVQGIITLYLANANECIEYQGGDGTTVVGFTVNNVQFHYSSMNPSPAWDALYNDRMKSKGSAAWNYVNYENQFFTSTFNSGLVQASQALSFRYSSLLGLIAVFRPAANLNSYTAQNKMNNFEYPSIANAQLRIGSYVQPINSTTSVQDLYTMFIETFGMSIKFPSAASVGFSLTNGQVSQSSPGTFVLAINTSKHPFEEVDSNNSINGINTAIANNLVLDLQFSVALPVTYQMDIFAISEQSLLFNANGSITYQR